MSRYSRREGPPANFELTGVFQQIPNLIITRYFDEGEVLWFFNVRLDSQALIAPNFTVFQLRIDGVSVTGADLDFISQPGGLMELCRHGIQKVSEGIHTFALFGSGAPAVGDFVGGNSSMLSLIQLPLWDTASDLIP